LSFVFLEKFVTSVKFSSFRKERSRDLEIK